MTYIDKSIVPHCFVTEKKFEWGEPYDDIRPIFNLYTDPELSDIAFTIEILGQNNFKEHLAKLYNILLNREEHERISATMEPVSNRQQLLERINHFLEEQAQNSAPWEDAFSALDEAFYLRAIEGELGRRLVYER
ncbi:MAG: hypothetical protein JNM21_13595 [Taibaiella sp.]|nr:hypothetical protein [Taibaiella sp.]